MSGAGVGVETPNELMVVFSDTVTAGFAALSGAVSGVFGLMIALVVALTGIQWALSSNREVLAAGFGKVLLIGAFAWIINDWQSLSETIYAGFLQLGLTAGGGSISQAEFLNPGAVLAQGWEIVKALGETPAPVNNPLDIAGNLTDAVILSLAMLGIMLAFAVLALQIIVSLIEFKIVTLGGFVLLPFGIWSKSAFLAERPLGYVVSSGLKVLALAIVVSGARSIFDQLQPTANPDIYEALAILVASLLLAMLAIFIPNLASALVTGGPSLGAGAAVTAGVAVGGAGLLAGAGAVGVGAAAAGKAASVSGASRAAAGSGLSRRSPPPPPPPAQPPAPPAPSGGGGGTPPSTGPRPATASSAQSATPRSAEPATLLEPPKPPSKRKAPEPIGDNAEAKPGRGAAFRAYFTANQARGLMPAGESSGSLSPTLKSEKD